MSQGPFPQDPLYGELSGALAAQQGGDLAGAVAWLRDILRRHPGEPRALGLLGNFLLLAGNAAEAVPALQGAAGRMPIPMHLHDLGIALFQTGRLAEAEQALQQAILMGLREPGAWVALGYVRDCLGDLAGAVDCLQQAARVPGPHQTSATVSLAHVLGRLADWPGQAARLGELARLVREGQGHGEPFPLLALDVPAEVRRLAARRMTAWNRETVPQGAGFTHRAEAPERLRVGYLSSDFHRHPTAFLLAEVLERHDRGAVEVIAFSHGPDDGSPMRARLEAGVDAFHDLSSLTDGEAADLIHRSGVHVLVDLKGFTQGVRPGILLRRPAPVLVHWLGYPGTLGGLVDAIIGDAVVTPPGCEGLYDEAVVRLPVCYQPNDARRPVGPCPDRAALGLPKGAVVFCGFNAIYKLNEAVWRCWMRVLRGVEGSVLWLLEPHPMARQALIGQAAAAGIGPERLVFAPVLPNSDLGAHIGRHAAADLFLDTWPYGAHTTASDALWAGLPVLTWAGEGFAARVAASLLHHLGLDGLVMPDADAYVARAIALGNDPAARRDLRERLAAARTRPGGPFDASATARALEAAYRSLYEGWTRSMAATAPSPR